MYNSIDVAQNVPCHSIAFNFKIFPLHSSLFTPLNITHSPMAKFTMPDMHNAARLHTTTFHPKSRSNNSRKAILSRKAPVADRL